MHVRKRQAQFADGLLRGHGVNVTSRVLSKPIHVGKRWGIEPKRVGVIGWMVDLLKSR